MTELQMQDIFNEVVWIILAAYIIGVGIGLIVKTIKSAIE